MKESKTIETELHAEEFVLVFTATKAVRRHPANGCVLYIQCSLGMCMKCMHSYELCAHSYASWCVLLSNHLFLSSTMV